MKNLFKALMIMITLAYIPVSYGSVISDRTEKNYFLFTITNYHTTRQSGQVVNIYVKYAYPKNLPSSDYPDYRKLRTSILQYMEPTKEFPADVYWEILATQMGKELMHNFPLSGVSIQLYVLDNPAGNEPSDHGPIYTIGDITPLDIHS